MPDLPIFLGHGGGYTSCESFGGFNLVANASANVKGAYVEMVTATAYDADGFIITTANAGNANSHLYDIAVGGAGAETIILANILHAGHSRMTSHLYVPIAIPAGTRISGRQQADTGALQLQARITLVRGGLWRPSSAARVDTYGANTANSFATAVDCGAAANTKGSWSQIAAATSADIGALLVRVGNRANSAPADSALAFYLDIGVGAAGSEVAVLASLPFSSSTNGSYGWGMPFWLPVDIPAGSRIAARAQSNVTDATDRVFDVEVLALA